MKTPFHLIIPGTQELRLLSVLCTKSALVALVPDARVFAYSAEPCFEERDLTSAEYLIAVERYDWEAFKAHPDVAEHTWYGDLQVDARRPGMLYAGHVEAPSHGPTQWDTFTPGIRPAMLPESLKR